MPKLFLRCLLVASVALPGVIAGCSDSVPLQVMDESSRVQGAINSPERVATSSTGPADAAALRVEMPHGGGAWTFQATSVDDSSYAIHVIDDHGAVVQTIEDIASRPPFATRDLLDIRDYNADGYPDIRARTLSVGASAISGGVLYVFRPESRAFVESEGIDQEGDIAVESDGCISVEYRSDAMNYSKDHYCWEADQWKFQRTSKD
jgi:hypothetical protein